VATDNERSLLRRSRVREPQKTRTYRIPIYVSQEEMDRISEAAAQEGMSTSYYCRVRSLKGAEGPRIAM